MLREFLYVDVARARSLLAQLDEGVVETVVGTSASKVAWDTSMGISAIKGARSSESSDSSQMAKSLQDLVFVIFEDIAESIGLIRSITNDQLNDPHSWEDSSFRAQFIEGELIRVFTPVIIVDPVFVDARFAKFLDMTMKLNALNRHNVESSVKKIKEAFDIETESLVQQLTGGRDERKNSERKLRRQREMDFNDQVDQIDKLYAQVDEAGLSELFEFMKAYLSVDSIYVRFLACGDAFPEKAFIGSLLSRDEYIQRERETLYSRYGARIEGWTSVLQVARVPDKSSKDSARTREFSDLGVADEEGINRETILHAAAHLEEMMEARGIVEGPVFPGISVVPLAIYRTVPRSVDIPVISNLRAVDG